MAEAPERAGSRELGGEEGVSTYQSKLQIPSDNGPVSAAHRTRMTERNAPGRERARGREPRSENE